MVAQYSESSLVVAAAIRTQLAIMCAVSRCRVVFDYLVKRETGDHACAAPATVSKVDPDISH
jgi:hypothetical protein